MWVESKSPCAKELPSLLRYESNWEIRRSSMAASVRDKAFLAKYARSASHHSRANARYVGHGALICLVSDESRLTHPKPSTGTLLINAKSRPASATIASRTSTGRAGDWLKGRPLMAVVSI